MLQAGKQTTAETRTVGGVSKSVYSHYAAAIGGCSTVFMIVFLYIAVNGCGAIGEARGCCV